MHYLLSIDWKTEYQMTYYIPNSKNIISPHIIIWTYEYQITIFKFHFNFTLILPIGYIIIYGIKRNRKFNLLKPAESFICMFFKYNLVGFSEITINENYGFYIWWFGFIKQNDTLVIFARIFVIHYVFSIFRGNGGGLF